MRRVRAVWDRERTSVKNKPLPIGSWLVGTPAWPSALPWATSPSPLQAPSQLLS